MTQTIATPSASFRVFAFLIAALSLALLSPGVQAQRRASTHAAPPEDPSPLFNAYRGVHLGMSADEARKKLGEPKEKGTEQDFYIFSETETAQIVYDKTQKVVTISADFTTAGSEVITAKQVFGADIDPKADGSVYKMVRYPKAGYWLSYNRTSGASPLTTVTLQKIQ
jgi:hypothetical protein